MSARKIGMADSLGKTGHQASTMKLGDQGEGMDVEQINENVDPDALAYIKTKRKVDDLHKAKKLEKKGTH